MEIVELCKRPLVLVDRELAALSENQKENVYMIFNKLGHFIFSGIDITNHMEIGSENIRIFIITVKYLCDIQLGISDEILDGNKMIIFPPGKEIILHGTLVESKIVDNELEYTIKYSHSSINTFYIYHYNFITQEVRKISEQSTVL